MFKRTIFVLVSGCLLCVWAGWVEALEVVKLLDGYFCMGLKADKEVNDWVPVSLPPPQGGPNNPAVFEGPTEASARLGYTFSPVIVKEPLNEVNGFTEVLRINGQRGWVSSSLLVPYGTVVKPDGTSVKKTKHCRPSMMSNGKIGFDFGKG